MIGVLSLDCSATTTSPAVVLAPSPREPLCRLRWQRRHSSSQPSSSPAHRPGARMSSREAPGREPWQSSAQPPQPALRAAAFFGTARLDKGSLRRVVFELALKSLCRESLRLGPDGPGAGRRLPRCCLCITDGLERHSGPGHVQPEDGRDVIALQNLLGGGSLLRRGQDFVDIGDQIILIHSSQAEQKFWPFVQPRADAVQDGRDVLAHRRVIGTAAGEADFRGSGNRPLL